MTRDLLSDAKPLTIAECYVEEATLEAYEEGTGDVATILERASNNAAMDQRPRVADYLLRLCDEAL